MTLDSRLPNSPNFKERFIADGLAYLIANWTHMSQWEQEWINAVRRRPPKAWSVKMYNKLQQIVEEAKGNIPRKRFLPKANTLSPRSRGEAGEGS